MTTSTKSVNKLGGTQGLHPNSLANLHPNLNGRPPNPLTITSRQKEKLLEPCPFDSQGRTWIEALSEGGMRQALNIPTAMANLQDRHEGKVPGDGAVINFNEIKILIVREAPRALPEVITEQVTNGKEDNT